MHTPFTPSLTERPAGAPLRVLQVTDPHLMDDPDGALLGMKTCESLQAVLDLVDREEGAPDLVLASGDISQDGSEGSYRQFQAIMARFACPVIWMAGNHDDAAVMANVIAGTDAARRRIMAGGWQIVCLDSSVPGHVHGEIAPPELAFLRDCLDDAPDTPTLVVFHHHPVDIGCPWMERIGLINRAELRAAIAGHAQVRGLLWGHVHQEWEDQRDGMRLMATPSTCIQFEPGSTDFSLDERAPGYRWLELYPDGALISHVRRTTDYQYHIERDSHGY